MCGCFRINPVCATFIQTFYSVLISCLYWQDCLIYLGFLISGFRGVNILATSLIIIKDRDKNNILCTFGKVNTFQYFFATIGGFVLELIFDLLRKEIISSVRVFFRQGVAVFKLVFYCMIISLSH